MEELAEELERLNARTPAREWPDMVVVADTGTINYGGQFPGDGELSMLLPPAEGTLDNFTPPMYIAMVMKAAGSHAFGQMTALLIAHLAIFTPGVKLPNFGHILETVPQIAVMISGYQYNLMGEIHPVLRQFYNDRYFPPLPISRSKEASFSPRLRARIRSFISVSTAADSGLPARFVISLGSAASS